MYGIQSLCNVDCSLATLSFLLTLSVRYGLSIPAQRIIPYFYLLRSRGRTEIGFTFYHYGYLIYKMLFELLYVFYLKEFSFRLGSVMSAYWMHRYVAFSHSGPANKHPFTVEHKLIV